MKTTEAPSRTAVPLLGICDLAKHHLRPVITALTKVVGGREEFEILMVCARCGYTRNARQLQQASEQLVIDVLEEVEQEAEEGAGTSKKAGDSAQQEDDAGTKSGPGNLSRKKPN